MVVYFVASRSGITERIEELRRFVRVIHEEGHNLALDWLEPIYASELKSGKADVDWPVLHKDTIEAITRADVMVADISIQSFGVGYQVAAAMHLKKPVLLLHSDKTEQSVFATGIPRDNAVHKAYNDSNIDGIIRTFLADNDLSPRDMRFNFFIDRPIYNYLRWASVRKGKTKAEILRELVQKEIDKEDYDL